MTKSKDPADNVQNKLLQKLIKASGDKLTNTLDKSEILNNKDFITTSIPAVNLALSGRFDGGVIPGLIMLAGPSKHFKTLFMLVMMKAYLDKYPDAVAYLFDSEFGAALEYFTSLGIDPKRVIHDPITDIEDMKNKSMNVLKAIERGDKVFLGVDSVGNLASKKEVDDAVDGKVVVDMTRAKALKSLGRMITPHLTIKDIPMVVVNHSYKTLEMFSKNVVGGGTGLYYSANDIWMIGRQQEKSTKGKKEVLGYNFIINIEKSRKVREKSQIPVTVLFDGGIYKYSAILDLAKDLNFIVGDGKTGYRYYTDDPDEVDAVKKSEEINAMCKRVLAEQDFRDQVEEMFTLSNDNLISDDLDEQTLEELESIDDQPDE